MPAKSKETNPGFTLVELILVLALLVILLAVAAPAISQSFKHQALKDETTRLLALTEYARSEAVSQGIPMIVWIDSQNQGCGVKAKAGFESLPSSGPSRSGTAGSASAVVSREKSFALAEGMRFEVGTARVGRDGQSILAEFSPEGTPADSSLGWVRILDRRDQSMDLVLSEDGWGYEIQEEGQ
jgi:prepilin-type N-terminal cleavage/methylation domain-containing protein